MKTQTIISLNTSFYGQSNKDFYSCEQLKYFLQHFDFGAPRNTGKNKTGLPTIDLNVQVVIRDGDAVIKSKPLCSCRLLVASEVYELTPKPGERKVVAVVPTKSVPNDSGVASCEYKKMKITPATCDAVINPQSLDQLWPKCPKRSRSRLNKFFTNAMRIHNKWCAR